MAHLHKVYDTDSHFIIDPVTRAINADTVKKYTVIQGDHNSERFTFEITRHVEGHDMSVCNKIEVHYINISKGKKDKHEDVYIVDDMQKYSEDENVVIFSWLLSKNATGYAGSLNFLIRFLCVNENGVIEYAWNTAIFSGISVSDGINNSESVVEDYSDVLWQWKQEIFSDIIPMVSRAETAATRAEQSAVVLKNVAGNVSNALKRSKSGEAVFLDDVSTAEHEMDIKVSSRNLLKPFVATAIRRGVTFEPQANGSIRVYGTNDGTGRSYVNIQQEVQAGTYYLSGMPGGSRDTYCFELYRQKSGGSYYDIGDGAVCTIPETQNCTFQIWVCEGQTVNFVAYPQLAIGNSTVSYHPYLDDLSSVKVLASGKNLIPYPYNAYKDSTKGMFANNGDGSITVNGEISSTPSCTLSNFTLPKGTYTISSGVADRTLGLSVRLLESTTGYCIAHSLDNSMTTFTLNEPTSVRCNIFGSKDKTYDNIVIYPMVEYGTTATEYALYVEPTEYAVEADGVAKGIVGDGEYITLYTDTDGTFIDCNYNIDINKAYKEICNAILSLGGNV